MTPRPRDLQQGAEALQATRAALLAAAAAKLPALEMRVYVVIVALTTTYQRSRDDLYLAAIASEIYGEPVERWQSDKVGRALAALDKKGLIVRDDPRRGPTGDGRGPRYSIGPAIRPERDAFKTGESVPEETQSVSSMRPNRVAECVRNGSLNPPEMRRPTDRGFPIETSDRESTPALDLGDRPRSALFELALSRRALQEWPGAVANGDDELEDVLTELALEYSGPVVAQALPAITPYAYPSELRKRLRVALGATARRAAPGTTCRRWVEVDGVDEVVPCPVCRPAEYGAAMLAFGHDPDLELEHVIKSNDLEPAEATA